MTLGRTLLSKGLCVDQRVGRLISLAENNELLAYQTDRYPTWGLEKDRISKSLSTARTEG
jgi:hypothetical protein